MINIYPFEGENISVKCKDGRTYTGVVTRCSPACGIDECDDILMIGRTEILASEIEEIAINISDIPVDKEVEDYPDNTIFIFSEGEPPKIDPKTGEVIPI